MRTISVSLPFRPYTNILFVYFYTTVNDQIKAELLEELTDYTENKMENESNLTLTYLHSYKLITTVEIRLEILKKTNPFNYDVSASPPQLKLLRSHPLI
jgi:murein tripeptide amidase MpaA